MTANTTGQALATLTKGRFHTLQSIQPCGSLQARRQASGFVAFYWRYSIGKTSERVEIGLYDSSAPPKSLKPTAKGYSTAAAIRASEELALEHYNHRKAGGRPALKVARARDEVAAAEQIAQASKLTLTCLLADYCDHLKALGRSSHGNARSIFELHVNEAWPMIASMPAKEVTAEHVANMMRRCNELGKCRTGNKLRAFAHSAFNLAKASRANPAIPQAFMAYNITSNPVSDTLQDGTANRADKRPLSAAELRAYWNAIKTMPAQKGALLRLHLLTGGQRIAQLMRLRNANIHPDFLLIHDNKGRPGAAPRNHVVPLIPAAVEALQACRSTGEYALSSDGGVTHIDGATMSAWAANAARDVVNEFQTKRIRSGVETLLASARVQQDSRGRLQSHGISGIQSRHYDDYDYLNEKLEALQTLYQLLNSKHKKSSVRSTRSA